MSAVPFSSRGLRSEVRSTDGWDYAVDFSEPLDDYMEEADQILRDPAAALANYNTFPVGRRQAVSYSEYPTVLALRLLGTYLKRRYVLQTETREVITRGIIQALSDSTPMMVMRRDIASFYENVPTASLKEDLLYKDVLPPRARRMLEVFFDIHCVGAHGLPRGLGLSAVLSEFVMKNADAAIRLLPGVYRYHRFVDDIIVFCADSDPGIGSKVAAALPAPLRLNRKKCADISIAKPKGGSTGAAAFEYLGYSYVISLDHSPKRARMIRVGIAESKLNRMMTKLILAARAYALGSDFELFYTRVQFLAGNYRFIKRRPLASTGTSVVKSGIYYNYRYCGDYQGFSRSVHPMGELKRLDWFLQNSVLGPRHALGRFILNQLSPNQLARVRRLSFAQGHLKVYNASMTSTDVERIKAVWKNV